MRTWGEGEKEQEGKPCDKYRKEQDEKVENRNHTRCILSQSSSSSTVTYILHRTQQRTSMEEEGEGRTRERKRDEGREGVSEGLKVEKTGKLKGEQGTREKHSNSTEGGWKREGERYLIKMKYNDKRKIEDNGTYGWGGGRKSVRKE